MTPTPPLNKKYPNWNSVIDHGIPVISTLLFGFSGAYFVQVAVAGDTLGEVRAVSFYAIELPKIAIKSTILVLTGLSCITFFASAISGIYSQLRDAEPFLRKIEMQCRSIEQADLDRRTVDRLQRKQNDLRYISIISFNIGVFLLPISGLLLLPTVGFYLSLFIYFTTAIILFLLTR